MRSRYLIVVTFLVIVSSCIDDALFNGGPTKTQEISLADFSVIEAKNTFEIELVSDTVNKALVTCGANLHQFIGVKVVNDILYLDHDIKNSWSRDYEKVKIELHTKPFSSINVRKPVKLTTKGIYKAPGFSIVDWGKYTEMDVNLDVDYCAIIMSSDNFGQFKAKGKAGNADIWGWGSCFVRADSLITSNCNVLHRGMGNVFVNATNSLNVSIEFSGNVYYSGNPAQVNIQNHSGSGSLYKR
ncbi:MAG TPA: DUF2807 domain-containing protein [Bacteroidales bacterium]|nr:DUF2807 domain-containing protein [Bacteroidales bacterium]